MFPDYNKDICSVVGPMDSAPVCVDFKHKLNSRSSKSDVSRETFLGKKKLINSSFFTCIAPGSVLSWHNPANAETIKVFIRFVLVSLYYGIGSAYR